VRRRHGRGKPRALPLEHAKTLQKTSDDFAKVFGTEF
jgi:hypothetical protein